MADTKASDTKGPTGVKTTDSKRQDNPDTPQMVAGADADLQNRRYAQSGDTTSSSGGANIPGQHGRDGGEINEISNNPAPSDSAIAGEKADDMQRESDSGLQKPAEEEGTIKKL